MTRRRGDGGAERRGRRFPRFKTLRQVGESIHPLGVASEVVDFAVCCISRKGESRVNRVLPIKIM